MDSLKIAVGSYYLEFVRIPEGEFVMGNETNKSIYVEYPQHNVFIDSFYMSKFPVTRLIYSEVINRPVEKHGNLNTPIVGLTWRECLDFAGKLDCPGYGITLPTDAEWEYACRAGSTGDFSDGSCCNASNKYYENDTLTKLGWFAGNSDGSIQPVGRKKPNSFGLFDMHGNVFEWCLDGERDYTRGRFVNPVGAIGGSERCVRGGSYDSLATWCRVSYKEARNKNERYDDVGFRLVMRMFNDT